MSRSKRIQLPLCTSVIAIGAALLFAAPAAFAQAATAKPFEIAQNRGERSESRRREAAPPEFEKRGHEQPIQVIRRSATPIPRVSNSTKKYRHSGRRFRSGHYYHRHIHHLHCGHDYYWDQGDEFESRTLGRSCIYGPKGEVIYKPADVICAPEEAAPPAAAETDPGPAPR